MQPLIANPLVLFAAPTAAAALTQHWRDWDASAWGVALLAHYFHATSQSDPLLRLSVTAEELTKAVHAFPSEASDVREAFLNAIACTPDEFRAHLRTGSLRKNQWLGAGPPPFLPYLLFTCYAAATLDEVVADQGDFRGRIRDLLGHPSYTSYDLEDLPTLWHALRDWLTRLREAGAPVRRLELPNPGYMNRIGYSIRLAFPQRKDRERLVAVLSSADYVANLTSSTMPEAFALVERRIREFSSDFNTLFRRAKDVLARGGDSPDLRLVWSAIREAVATTYVGRKAASNTPRFHLIAYDDERGHLGPVVVTDRPISTGATGIACAELPNHVEGYSHYLCSGQAAPRAVTNLLLHEALSEKRLPLLAKTPLARAVADGVLLFRPHDATTWTLCLTRESEGPCRALVRRDRRRDLTAEFRMLLPARGVETATDVFDGWDELSGFDFADIADPVVAAPSLEGVRALQRIAAGAQIHLVGGLRTSSGFLGTAGLLPEIRCTGATQVAVFEAASPAAPTTLRRIDLLVAVPDRPGAFSWPAPRRTMFGPKTLVASSGSGELASRAVLFESAVVGDAYAGPSDPTSWIVEGGLKDTVTADVTDAFLAQSAPARVLREYAAASIDVDAVNALYRKGIDDDKRFDELVEALAGIGLRRRGIPEKEFLDVCEGVGILEPGVSRWDVVRAWAEAGYIDVLINPRWRGRMYFPRSPRLVALPVGAGISRLVLHGLPCRITRHRVRQTFSELGVAEEPMASLSPDVPVPLAWRVHGEPARLNELSGAASLPLWWCAAIESLIGEPDRAFSVGASAPSVDTRVQTWDWADSVFRIVTPSTMTSTASAGRTSAIASVLDVIVDRHVRPDGPDEYRVAARDGETLAVTRSRTWALLRAFASAGRAPFVPHGTRCLVRDGEDGAYFPLPAARAIQLWSGTLSGPAVMELGRRYAYAAPDQATRRRLLAVLAGKRVDVAVDRRLAWLRAAVDGNRSARVPIPRDIRLRLEAMSSTPDANALVKSMVPPSLLPHLRCAVSPDRTSPWNAQ